MSDVRISYYALFREQAGRSDECMPLVVSTAAELYAQLQTHHGFALPISQLRVAVNDVFVPWETSLSAGDHVVFIPPVAGG